MKHKALLAVSGAIIVVILLGFAFFALGGQPSESSVSIDLSGTWEVAATVQNGAATLIDQEYMVFDETTAEDFRDGSETPYASTEYKIEVSDTVTLQLVDLSRSYVVEQKSQNIVRLYENPDCYLVLLRSDGMDTETLPSAASVLTGKWRVVYRNTNEVMDEVLAFDGAQLTDYRNGSQTPTSTMNYEWDEAGFLVVDSLSKTFKPHPRSDDLMILVETDTGDCWELERME